MSSEKIQGGVPSYHKFVIDELVGIEGTSASDVVSRIVGFWIRENQERLDGYGITLARWKNGTLPVASDKVIPYPNKESGEATTRTKKRES